MEINYIELNSFDEAPMSMFPINTSKFGCRITKEFKLLENVNIFIRKN